MTNVKAVILTESVKVTLKEQKQLLQVQTGRLFKNSHVSVRPSLQIHCCCWFVCFCIYKYDITEFGFSCARVFLQYRNEEKQSELNAVDNYVRIWGCES